MPIEANLAGFRAQFPELGEGDYPDTKVNPALEEAKMIHNLRPLATLLAAAHYLVLAKMRADDEAAAGNAGPLPPRGRILSGGTGPMRVRYQAMSELEKKAFTAYFEQTSYGERFLMLEMRTPSAIGARIV